MAQYETIRSVGAGARTAQIDEGLRAHMNKVYGLMSAGMAVTGIVAYLVGSNDALLAHQFGSSDSLGYSAPPAVAAAGTF